MESKTLGGTKILKESARFSDYGPPTLNATQKNDAFLPSQKECVISASIRHFWLPSPKKPEAEATNSPIPCGVKHFSSMSCPRATTSDDIRQIRACDDSVNLPIAPLARRNPRRGETVGPAGKGSNPKEQRSFKTLGLLVYDGMFEMGLWNNPPYNWLVIYLLYQTTN